MYAFFLKQFILPLGDFLFGGGYLKTFNRWKSYDRLSEHELNQIQEERLKETLIYTIKNVPFYQNISYDEKISPEENLKKFPVLTKELLRNPDIDLISKKYKKENLRKNFSSGSSGVQSFSHSDKNYVYFLQGLSYHWYRWGGLEWGDKVLQLGISPKRTLPKKLKDFFFRVDYREAFTLDDQKCKAIYQSLKRKKIRFIIGYPSAINQLAEYMIENDLRHPLKTIISLGDKLFSHFENHFKTAFESPLVIDTYGCAEGILMACRFDLPFYYISSPHVFIEIVDDKENPVPDGEIGHVLVTCFDNLAQPFIRYKLGDLAVKLPKEKYPKDRKFNYSLLERVVGRETDVVKTPHGKTLIVHSFTGIIEYFPDIKQYQIIQENLDEIRIKYIVDEYLPLQNDTLENIKSKIDKLTNGSLRIHFEQTDFIPDSPSGKPQIIKSLL